MIQKNKALFIDSKDFFIEKSVCNIYYNQDQYQNTDLKYLLEPKSLTNNGIFTIIIDSYDQLSKIKTGCNKFEDCILDKHRPDTNYLSFIFKKSTFYNNSEMKHIRSEIVQNIMDDIG